MRALALAVTSLLCAACQCATLQPARFACATDGDCPGSFCASDQFCDDPGAGGGAGGSGGGGGGSGGAAQVRRPGCTNGWCWDHPRPFGRVRLYGVHARAPDDVWISGELGTLFHFDGTGWAQQVTPADVVLNAVWQSNAQDVWAVGAQGTILHLVNGQFVVDRSGVAASYTGELFAIDGPPAGPPVVAGGGGRIMRLAASSWVDSTAINSSTFNAVAARFPGSEIVIGNACRGWNGTTFVPCPLPAPGTWLGAYQVSPTETWVSGSGGALYRSATPTDGGWQQVDSGTTTTVRSVWADGAGEVYIGSSTGLATLSGSTALVPRAIARVHGSGPGEVWGVTQASEIFRRTGGAPFVDGKGLTGLTSIESMTGVAVSTSGFALITADRHAVYLRELNGTWTRLDPPPNLGFGWYRAAWLDAQMRGWVVGDDPIRLARYDHANRQVAPVSVNIAEDLFGVWGADDENVWAVGRAGAVYRLQGGTWNRVTIPGVGSDLNAVWGTSADDVYVAGNGGVIAHFANNAWTLETAPAGLDYYGLAGASATEVYAASNDGIYRRNPSTGQWTIDGLAGTTIWNLAVASGKWMALSSGNEVSLKVGPAWVPQLVPWVPNGGASEGLACLGGADGVGFFLGGNGSAIFRWGLAQ